MKNKAVSENRIVSAATELLALLICAAIMLSCCTAAHADSAGEKYTAAQVQSLCDGIVAYKAAQSGDSGAQGLIDGYLTDNAGSISEFYIIGLSQYGVYRFDNYEKALLGYIGSSEVYSASTREKYALALIASGSTSRYISDTANEAIGGLGLMSLVFGLHILSNGYDSAIYDADGLISEILSYQLSDGGWAVMGSHGDIDVTAMTIQSLAPYCGLRSDVASAVDRALTLLSDKQRDNGGFVSIGVENCESCAQVLTALSALGIDAQHDGRFIKNGRSVLNAMMDYRVSDGSFSHTGGGFNESATVQAFYSLVAYLRLCRGQGPLYVFDNVNRGSAEQPLSDIPAQNNIPQKNNSPDGPDLPDNGGSGNNGAVSAENNTSAAERKAASEPKNASEKSRDEVSQAPTLNTQATDKPAYGGFQPSATADMTAATAEESGSGGYKVYAVIGVIAAAAIACLVLFLLKKRGKNNYIAVGIIAVVGIIIILITNFESVESHSQAPEKNGDLTVTMTVRCDTIKGMEKVNDHIPDDCVILEKTEFEADEGDTVFDILLLANKRCGLPFDNRGAQGSAYIAAINYLYEFDYGELSGWMYRVNGVLPEVGCQSYYLSDGDEIEWLYTTNIGKDLSDKQFGE